MPPPIPTDRRRAEPAASLESARPEVSSSSSRGPAAQARSTGSSPGGPAAGTDDRGDAAHHRAHPAIARLRAALAGRLERLRRRLLPPRLALLEVGSQAYVTSGALVTAVHLGIPDLLAGGPKPVSALATATATDPASLARLMRALASAGLFADTRDGFRLTRLSRCLLADAPGSMRPLITMVSQKWYQQLWTGLSYSVKTGKPAAEWVLGAPLFQYFDDHPAAAEAFHRAMAGFSADAAAGLLAAWDFSPCSTVVDVGGGYGRFLALLLTRYPALRGTLVERPGLAAVARDALQSHPARDRINVVASDFFTAVPPGADTYVLMHVLHNWDDAHAATILRTCRNAMRADSTLLVVEMLIPPDTAPFFGTLFDLEMLVLFGGGRERTADEFRALLHRNGFAVSRTIPTPSFSSVLEAQVTRPPD